MSNSVAAEIRGQGLTGTQWDAGGTLGICIMLEKLQIGNIRQRTHQRQRTQVHTKYELSGDIQEPKEIGERNLKI
jgi:hypothetical protein